jgi:ornithine carbamoyltransferase
MEAVKDAHVVVTDTWISMGEESERDARIRAFKGFTVDNALMKRADPDAIFLHCLPAHRGREVTDEVIEGPQSVVFDEAENRLHAQKAVLVKMLGREI